LESNHEPASEVVNIIFVLNVCGGILIAIGSYLISFGSHRSYSIWFFFSGAVLILLSGALYLYGGDWDSDQKPDSPHFSARFSWTQDTEGGTQIWINRDPEIVHVQRAMVVYFTNLRNVPLMIISSTLEQQTTDGDWKGVGQTLFGEDHVFLGIDPKDVVKTTYKTFESVSQNRNIAPNETIFGWVFMRKRPTGDLRLSVTYADGTVHSEPIENMASGEGFPDIPKPVSTGEHFDFSKHQIIK
jgi:hypothetical protein